MWQTIGHQNPKTILEHFLSKEAFPHALLFSGPSGVGKRTLALEYAARVLGDGGRVSSDVLLFDAGQSDVDQTRHFLQQLALTPAVGKRKVAIIDNIDQASAIIGNTLLKTLEEPSASTHLILISGTTSVMPTISSRCQLIHFNRLSQTDLAIFADQLSPAPNKEILALSSGRPGLLYQLVNDPERLQRIQSTVAVLERAVRGSSADQLSSVTELAEQGTEDLAEALRVWLDVRTEQLKSQPQQFPLVSRVLEALAHLNGTFNKKLVLQRLLLHT